MSRTNYRSTIIAFALLALGLGMPRQARAVTTGAPAEVACGGTDAAHTLFYRTRHGVDTPDVIAEKLYGHVGRKWYQLVMDAAGINDPRKLPSDVILMLPGACEAQALVSAGRTQTTRASATSKPRSSYSTYLDHNPLNLIYGRLTRKWVDQGYATVKPCGGYPYLSFNDTDTGLAAAADLMFSSGFYSGMTLDRALRKWSGGQYGSESLKAIAASLYPEARTELVGQLTGADRTLLLEAVARREDARHWKEAFSAGSARTSARSVPEVPAVAVGAILIH